MECPGFCASLNTFLSCPCLDAQNALTFGQFLLQGKYALLVNDGKGQDILSPAGT